MWTNFWGKKPKNHMGKETKDMETLGKILGDARRAHYLQQNLMELDPKY